jgi:hypothetical protein
MVKERQGELPGRHGGPDPLQRKPSLGARAGQPDTPHVARAERLPAVTRHQDAELDQSFDVLGEDAGPAGQFRGGELIHANHLRYPSRCGAPLPMETLQVRTRRCGQVKGVLDGNWAEWFEGLEMRAVGDTTVISGTPRHDEIRARLEEL